MAYAALVENLPTPVMLMDVNGTIMLLNPAMQKLIGADAEGHPFFEYLGEAEAHAAQQCFDTVLQQCRAQQFLGSYPDKRATPPRLYEQTLSPIRQDHHVVAVMLQARDVQQETLLHQEQVRQRTLLDIIFSHAALILWMMDNHGVITFSEGRALSELGIKPGEHVGHSMFELYQDYPAILTATRQSLQGQLVDTVVIIQSRMYHVHCQPLFSQTGQVTGVVGVAADITDIQDTLAQMQTLSSALEQTADLVMITDREGRIEYINPAFEQVTGYTRSELLQKRSNILRSNRHDRGFYKNLWDTILSGDPFTDVFVNKRKDNSIYYEEKTITPIRNTKGEIVHFVSTGRDVSDRMRTQERMQFMAHHDALTKLPNRLLFTDRLRQAIARSRWHQRLVAVISMDLDRFHTLNDQYGQTVCDHILNQLAKRLVNSVRTGDTVARLGSDDFAILLEDMASDKDVLRLAKKLLDSLAAPFVIEGVEYTVTASIGVSLFPNDGDDAETLLRNADVATHRAKEMGRNNYQFYSNEFSARMFERLTLENSLRQALLRQEFYLLYQPQYDVRTQKLVGLEALIRWQHPEMGVIAPNDFIPLLEETGLIVPVGEWALRQACQQASHWQQHGKPELIISVNVSGRQFNNPDFVATIQNIIADTGVNPANLELELTESMLMRNASKTISALNTIQHLGIHIAVDDFGTGYSSLNYLRRFPISTLKIDRSFIRDIAEDSDDAAIATAIIVMGQSLNLRVIAEGVENQEQLDVLQCRGCYLMQGNHLGIALTADEISALLQP